jgi:hypothetical protein
MENPMNEPTPKDVLIAAKKLIESPENWIKHHGCDDKGRLCAQYALLRALKGDDDPRELMFARMKAFEAMEKVVGSGSIYIWNDKPKRTHKQVMRAFDKAIAVAE